MTTQKWYKYSDKTTDQTDGSNTGRHNFIDRSIRFGLLEFEIKGNDEFEQEMISWKERVNRDREFTRFEQVKLRSSFRSIFLV